MIFINSLMIEELTLRFCFSFGNLYAIDGLADARLPAKILFAFSILVNLAQFFFSSMGL